MSNYDLQFQADLEKAQALSLESLALEQFRRQKLANTDNNVPRDNTSHIRRRDDYDGPPPALPPPPRRPSRGRSLVSDSPRSAGTSPTRDNSSDLISFSSPTSKTAPKDTHASFIEEINRLSQQADELSVATSTEQTPNMNNHYYNNRPGYPYNAQYGYNYQHPYVAAPPYPTGTPYGMPTPMSTPVQAPGPNYAYYTPPYTPSQDTQLRYPSSPQVYTPVPYNQTRLASPTPYIGYAPSPQPHVPQYNYSTTNMISRPIRPASIYPQLSQNSYMPPAANVGQNSNVINNNAQNNVVPAELPHVDSGENFTNSRPEYSRKTSEVSNVSNESNDTVGSLPKSLNLIDFGIHNGNNSQGSVRVSVLEAFDPLLTNQNVAEYTTGSQCSGSVYEEYDPLDFLYGETEMREAPVYATVNKKDPVSSPPPKTIPSQPIQHSTHKLYDCLVKVHTKTYDNEHKAFLKMILDLRSEFVYSDEKTNPGHVIASRSVRKYPPNTSIKILVHHSYSDEPITFTSDVESTVEHVIMTVVCSLNEEIREDMSGHMLRVWGSNEYLTSGSSLSEYEYVRLCVRLEKDVRLCLCEGGDSALSRSERDDVRAQHLTLDDLMPETHHSLSFDSLSILLETLEGELSRATGVVSAEGACSAAGVSQAVKAICALAGGLETLAVSHALRAFALACAGESTSAVTPEIVSELGAYSAVRLRPASARETLRQAAARLRDAVRALLALLARAAPSDCRPAADYYATPADPAQAVPAHTIQETTLFCLEAVHNLPPSWNYDDYVFHAQVYYGTRLLKPKRNTHVATIENSGFYPRIMFDTWLNLDDVPVSVLPREARLVLTLHGRTARAQAPEAEAEAPAERVLYDEAELGWAALQLYDYDGMLASGHYILPIWPPCADKRSGPAPSLCHPPPPPHPIINIEIPLYASTGVKWENEELENVKPLTREDLPSFDSLDAHTQSQLLHVIEQGAYNRMCPEEREKLWEKRQYLVDLPGALPLVLLAANQWYGEHRTNLLALLQIWEKPSPYNAMHLLLPCFPDAEVRSWAVRQVARLDEEELARALPQLVAALRLEAGGAALARLLLARALSAPRLAHRLHWQLRAAAEPRCRLLARALRPLLGERLGAVLARQERLVHTLSEVADAVKGAKEALRQRALASGVQLLAAAVRAEPVALPLALALSARDVDVKSCSYFNSNTLPLKINFIGCDNAVIPAMFKVGDDLRQDAIVLQVMRVMDSLWLKAGLDLRMVTFQAVPTSDRKGMIEIVSEAETLRAIQTEWGLTGSFKDKPIAEWLAKHNPSELEYQRARDNFTSSCAGYSVATYLLGICDRHNDNIMLKTSGHLFHIDFGKFLGDAQMFGNFKRDRAPFVLTHDMVYVINGGERPTQRFHHFVELCCTAFNIVRAHHDHILDLFALMAQAGAAGAAAAAVAYVRGALLLGASKAEAAAAFARLIHSSLKSKFTPINFFLHNLAQLRASGDQNNSTSELLSFMPRTYNVAQEGRLTKVEVLNFEKRYDPEKHYVYVLRIHRKDQPASVVYRSYKHFTELYQKVCMHFPLAKVHSLPSGLHVGRSNIRQVAERRYSDVQAFLTSLFSLADEIAHSDLVYTFFHPLLRDQQDIEPQRMKKSRGAAEAGAAGAAGAQKGRGAGSGAGSLKLSLQYAGGALAVLVLHAQSLALTPQGLPPSAYVKVYLIPDPTKETKRKTRVLKRNSHPSFMEMLEYRLPLDVIKDRTLQATVWNYDPLQENQFLGGVTIPLSALSLRQETTAWYPLEYITR